MPRAGETQPREPLPPFEVYCDKCKTLILLIDDGQELEWPLKGRNFRQPLDNYPRAFTGYLPMFEPEATGDALICPACFMPFLNSLGNPIGPDGKDWPVGAILEPRRRRMGTPRTGGRKPQPKPEEVEAE